jgi:glycosyltransferase involved in cell wall biosynthesis
MRRPRIAILSNYPVDHSSFKGGVEAATAALLEGLSAYGDEFDFHLLSVSNAIAHSVHERRDNVTYHFLGGLHREWVRPRLPLRVAKAFRFLRYLEPDLVHCQANPDLVLAAVLANHRPILTIHGVAAHEAPLRTGWEFWSTQTHAVIGRFVAPHLGAYICNSRYAADTLRGSQPRFPIPNAVSAIFMNANVDHNRAAAHDPPRLLFIGVLAPLKRAADLVDAHARLRHDFPTLETVLCGATEDRGYTRELKRSIKERQIAGVSFAGWVDHEGVAALLQTATVVVLPSAQENAPMAIAEAMAAGVPVIATEVGGVAEMISDGATGLLYEPGDVAALVERATQLLRDAGLRERISSQARQVAASRYTPQAVAAATVDVYRTLMKQRSAYRSNGTR